MNNKFKFLQKQIKIHRRRVLGEMPFKKQRDAIINKSYRKPKMNNSGNNIEFNEQIGKVRKARSNFGDTIGAEDIDSIPGIEILEEDKDNATSR